MKSLGLSLGANASGCEPPQADERSKPSCRTALHGLSSENLLLYSSGRTLGTGPFTWNALEQMLGIGRRWRILSIGSTWVCWQCKEKDGGVSVVQIPLDDIGHAL